MNIFNKLRKTRNEVSINNENNGNADSALLLHHIIELKESVATIKADVKILTLDMEKIKMNIKTLFGKVKNGKK